MSMYICVVRVTPATFERIKGEPALLEGVFEEDAAVLRELGIAEADSGGFDYGIADDMMDAMASLEQEVMPDDAEADPVSRDLGADGRLDHDGGYGNAFTLSPAAVKRAAKDSAVLELDPDVKQLFHAAAERGDHVIAIVS